MMYTPAAPEADRRKPQEHPVNNKLAFIIPASAAALLALASPASAHHPTVAATATCDEITVTAVAWQTDEADRRHNDSVTVTINGATATTGRFDADNDYRFTATFPAVAGTYRVVVTSAAPWGPAQQYGSVGESRSSAVTVPDCPPPTTAAPVPTTAAPVVVSAEIGTPMTVERAPVPERPAVEAPTVLAFTGRASALLALVGAGFVGVGVGLVASAKPRRGGRYDNRI